ncbi:MAG: metal-dependent hydrolase [Sphingomonadales bacterium]|nr:MAG: metal-dependent hydrolase [Sphingomonadales bacterium]
MIPRYPKMAFEAVEPHWARNRELAQHYNAASIVPSHIEPYLVRVMLKALPKIAKRDPQLAADIDIFNKQEVEHCKRHNAFNKMLREKGYPGISAFEKQLSDEYKDWLANRSLRFNIAYAEGFEAMGSSNAETFFEVLPLLEGSTDPQALELWKWHLAEEFEHRHVCFEVYHKLYGYGPIAWLYRCWGYLHAYRHLTRFMDAVADYLIEIDRKNMTPDQREKSKARVMAHRKMTRKRDMKQKLAVLSPFYNPSKKQPSMAMTAYLDSIPSAAP